MSNTSKNTLETGTVLGDKWVILELLGRGGMGEVYRVHQVNLKRDIAVKIISARFLAEVEDNEYEAESCPERFHREVQVMAQVRHPNVLQIFDCGSFSVKQGDEETPIEYIAMEYVSGGSLRSTMSVEGFYPDEDRMKEWLCKYFFPLLDGVEALHALGIVHRDLKPENVLLDGDIPKIADFGLARSCRLKPVTQSMDMRGTPPYMSPEHFLDLKRTDQRADIYALGKIFYEAIAGKMGPNTIPFKSARLPEADSPFFKELDLIIQKATAEEKAERFPSIEDFRQAVAAVLKEQQSEPSTARKTLEGGRLRWKRTTIAVVLLALIGLGVLYLHEKPHIEIPPWASAPGSLQESGAGAKPGEPSSLQSTGTPPERLQGNDYDVMHLVPGGEITLPRDLGREAGKSVKVKPFYMNESPITNQQYVDFLNKVLSRIREENGVLRSNGEIWLMLGEVTRGYEPIIFRDGHFYVKNATHSACPVLRVTGYGALAYVRFYGLRLPTAKEWFFAATKGQFEADNFSPAPSEFSRGMKGEMHGDIQQTLPSAQGKESDMPLMTPVIMFKPDTFGIRQLNKNIGEWGIRIGNGTDPNKEPQTEYVVMGALPRSAGATGVEPSVVQRNPWEAFEEVGFRCVRDAPENAS